MTFKHILRTPDHIQISYIHTSCDALRRTLWHKQFIVCWSWFLHSHVPIVLSQESALGQLSPNKTKPKKHWWRARVTWELKRFGQRHRMKHAFVRWQNSRTFYQFYNRHTHNTVNCSHCDNGQEHTLDFCLKKHTSVRTKCRSLQGSC